MRRVAVGASLLPVLAACGAGSGGGDMVRYLEFYFPPSTAASYNVVHEWGQYLIVTEAGPEDSLHPDSEPYRGFMTFRPYVAEGRTVSPAPLIYCVTPQGEVWVTSDTAAVPATKRREEIVDRGGGSTTVTTIESPSEAVIDSFRDNPEIWTRMGTLEVRGGKTSFRKEG